MSEKDSPTIPTAQTPNIETSSEAILQAQTNFTDRHNFTSIATANYNTSQKINVNVPIRPNSSRSSFVADDSASEISDADFQSSRGFDSSNYSSRVSTANSEQVGNRRKSAGNVANSNTGSRIGSGNKIQKPIPVRIQQNHSNLTPQNSQKSVKEKQHNKQSVNKNQLTSTHNSHRRQKNTSTSSTTSTNKNTKNSSNNNPNNSNIISGPNSQNQNLTQTLTSKNSQNTISSTNEISELKCRLASTSQENKCLLNELEVFKLRFNQLAQENRYLKLHHDKAAMRDKFEDEVISNTLLKKIQELKVFFVGGFLVKKLVD